MQIKKRLIYLATSYLIASLLPLHLLPDGPGGIWMTLWTWLILLLGPFGLLYSSISEWLSDSLVMLIVSLFVIIVDTFFFYAFLRKGSVITLMGCFIGLILWFLPTYILFIMSV